jgi:hypothetical protein
MGAVPTHEVLPVELDPAVPDAVPGATQRPPWHVQPAAGAGAAQARAGEPADAGSVDTAPARDATPAPVMFPDVAVGICPSALSAAGNDPGITQVLS